MVAVGARLPTWRAVASRVDVLRSTGLRHAWRRWRRDRALRPLADRRKEQIARALWADAAAELGATVTELGFGRLEIRRGNTVTRLIGQTVFLNSTKAVALADDKPAAYKVLERAGVEVPDHIVFPARDLRDARAFVARGPVPCVVKPAHGSGGDGVTAGVCTRSDLRRAALSASRFASRLLVERQAAGVVFRLLVLDDEVLDVLRRLPPRIEGDGASSVEELIFAEYDRRIQANGDPGLKAFAADLDCILTLRAAGLSLRSVPQAGTTVQVKTVTNYNKRDENQAVLTGVSDELKAQAVAAARAVGLRLAGVDVVTATARTGLDASCGVVVDVNATPALHHHMHVVDVSATSRVAVPILRTLLAAPVP